MTPAASPSRTSSKSTAYYSGTYAAQLQSCARGFPGSRAFFDQLTDFLRSDHGDPGMKLQSPKVYRVHAAFKPASDGASTIVPLSEVSLDETPSQDRRKAATNNLHPSVKFSPSGSTRVFPSKPDAYIVAIEGFPSPTCVETLGSRFNLRPELFLGHLGLIDPSDTSHFGSALPTLPSRRSNVMHVRMVSIGRAESSIPWQTTVLDGRSHADRLCHDWHQNLFQNRRFGATMVRKVHLHDDRVFHVEHTVSMSVTTSDNAGWTDQGRPLANDYHLPWARYTYNGHPAQFVPLIPYNTVPMEGTILNRLPVESADLSPEALQPIPTFHPADHLHVSSEEEFELMRQTPFFCLFRTLTVAALSWRQLLNVVEGEIRRLNQAAGDSSRHQVASEQLRWTLQLMDDVSTNITENQEIIMVQRATEWPWPVDESLACKLEELQTALTRDHDHLLAQCNRLIDQAKAASQAILQADQLLLTQRSIKEAREVGRLTLLAFFFLPMSFIASIFGMNVAELSQDPPIWVFLAIALPVSMATYLFASWGQIVNGVKTWFNDKRTEHKL